MRAAQIRADGIRLTHWALYERLPYIYFHVFAVWPPKMYTPVHAGANNNGRGQRRASVRGVTSPMETMLSARSMPLLAMRLF